MDSIGRQTLPHQTPLWIEPSREIYFVTICCKPRHENQLCHPTIAKKLFETVQHRNEKAVWFAHLFLLMPDHLHALLSFPPSERSLREVISNWKRWTATTLGIRWQRDFFEHRLRADESRKEKADYILANPVRAGLVADAKEWPYVWMPENSRDT